MAQYVLLQQEDIEEIVAAYDITVTGFEAMGGGASNSSYLLHSGRGRYVLTVFDNKTLDEADQIGQLLLVLEQHSFPTTRLLPTRSGAVTTIYRDKPVILKEYIPGQVCERLEEPMLRQAGAALARLHRIPTPDFVPDSYPYGWQVFPQVIGRNIDPEYESWLADRHGLFRRHLPRDLPRGLIHADLFDDNVLFEGENLKAIIDFEDVCRGQLGFDVGMAILGLCREQNTLAFDKAGAFVSGYQTVRSLAQEEIGALQLLVDYAATVTSYWRFWKYRIHVPTPEKADRHWQMVHFAEAVAATPAADFLEQVVGQAAG
jgi:homoserine kinase type II